MTRLTNKKIVNFYLNKSLLEKMFKKYPFLVLARTKNVDLNVIDDFEILNLPGPVFKQIFSSKLNGLIFGSMFLLGTNSVSSLTKHIEESTASVILIKLRVNDKNYVINAFDFNRVTQLDKLDSNNQIFSYFYN